LANDLLESLFHQLRFRVATISLLVVLRAIHRTVTSHRTVLSPEAPSSGRNGIFWDGNRFFLFGRLRLLFAVTYVARRGKRSFHHPVINTRPRFADLRFSIDLLLKPHQHSQRFSRLGPAVLTRRPQVPAGPCRRSAGRGVRGWAGEQGGTTGLASGQEGAARSWASRGRGG